MLFYNNFINIFRHGLVVETIEKLCLNESRETKRPKHYSLVDYRQKFQLFELGCYCLGYQKDYYNDCTNVINLVPGHFFRSHLFVRMLLGKFDSNHYCKTNKHHTCTKAMDYKT